MTTSISFIEELFVSLPSKGDVADSEVGEDADVSESTSISSQDDSDEPVVVVSLDSSSLTCLTPFLSDTLPFHLHEFSVSSKVLSS